MSWPTAGQHPSARGEKIPVEEIVETEVRAFIAAEQLSEVSDHLDIT
ncbi:hypothetical protein [Streptomyces sp. NPDC058622]